MERLTGFEMNGIISLVLIPLTLMRNPIQAQNVSSHYAQFDLEDLKSWYSEQLPHHRDKRFLWMTHNKKLVFPPGTQLVLTPTLAMPLLRYPPRGVDTNMTISTPFTSEYIAFTQSLLQYLYTFTTIKN